jgi:hypothetical protein
MPRGFIDLHQARCRSHAQPCGPELRSEGVLRQSRAHVRLGCPRAGRYHLSASRPAPVSGAAVTAMRGQRRGVAHLPALCTARVAPMARHHIHLQAALRFVFVSMIEDVVLGLFWSVPRYRDTTPHRTNPSSLGNMHWPQIAIPTSRVSHRFRAHDGIKLFPRQASQLQAGVAQAGAVYICRVGDLGCLVVADLGSQGRHQHQ